MRVAVFYGGVPIKQNIDVLNGDQKPHIIVGTPGRILELVRSYPVLFSVSWLVWVGMGGKEKGGGVLYMPLCVTWLFGY